MTISVVGATEVDADSIIPNISLVNNNSCPCKCCSTTANDDWTLNSEGTFVCNAVLVGYTSDSVECSVESCSATFPSRCPAVATTAPIVSHYTIANEGMIVVPDNSYTLIPQACYCSCCYGGSCAPILVGFFRNAPCTQSVICQGTYPSSCPGGNIISYAFPGGIVDTYAAVGNQLQLVKQVVEHDGSSDPYTELVPTPLRNTDIDVSNQQDTSYDEPTALETLVPVSYPFITAAITNIYGTCSCRCCKGNAGCSVPSTGEMLSNGNIILIQQCSCEACQHQLASCPQANEAGNVQYSFEASYSDSSGTCSVDNGSSGQLGMSSGLVATIVIAVVVVIAIAAFILHRNYRRRNASMMPLLNPGNPI